MAAGHEATAEVAREVLAAGGNAFDAVVAGHFAACVAEPVLASLGGGGFLLAELADGSRRLYDFFARTPLHRRMEGELDFHPIVANFGTVQQEFHVGRGSIATPGAIAGMAAIAGDLCRMSLRELAEPAVELARQGVVVNPFQAYIFEVVNPIYRLSPEVRRIYGGSHAEGRLAAGDLHRQPELADTLEALGREGPRLFHEGELGRRLVELCTEGGHLGEEDLRSYRVIRRDPLEFSYRGRQVITNPPPSSGGILIAFALGLLEQAGDMPPFGSREQIERLARVMRLVNESRRAHSDSSGRLREPQYLLSPPKLTALARRLRFDRGTTHISVADGEGNLAALTVSNGEGCGHLIPGSGVMPNNMLGEQDLNPAGFHRWSPGSRISSMMAPTLLHLADGGQVVLGSGGSNRLRSAILQVVSHLVDHDASLREAVDRPRLHYEEEQLNIEGGFDSHVVRAVAGRLGNARIWPDRNLYFGGVHCVLRRGDRLDGAGDPRRGGVVRSVG